MRRILPPSRRCPSLLFSSRYPFSTITFPSSFAAYRVHRVLFHPTPVATVGRPSHTKHSSTNGSYYHSTADNEHEGMKTRRATDGTMNNPTPHVNKHNRRVKVKSSKSRSKSSRVKTSSSAKGSCTPPSSPLPSSSTAPTSSSPEPTTTIYQLPTSLVVKGSMTAPLCWSVLPMIAAIVYNKNNSLSQYELLFHGDTTQLNLALGACVFSVLGGAAFNHLSSFCIQQIKYHNDTRMLTLRRLSYFRWLYPDMHVAVDCVLPPYGRFADYAKQEAQGSVQLEWLESPRSSSSSLSSLMSPLTRPVAALFTRTLDGMLYGSSAKDVDLPPALSMGMPPSAYESVPREEHGTRLENRFFVMVMDNTVSDVVGLEKLNHIIRYNRSNVV